MLDDTSDDTSVVNHVRVLLGEAQRAGTAGIVEDADRANDAAFVVLARYGIATALRAEAGRLDDPIERTRIPLRNPDSAAKAHLLSSTGAALRLRCTTHILDPRRATGDAVTLFGFGSDIARTKLVYASLWAQGSQQVTRLVRGGAAHDEPVSAQGRVAAYRRRWLGEFTDRVCARLLAAETDPAASQARIGTNAGRLRCDTESVRARRLDRVARAYAEQQSEPLSATGPPPGDRCTNGRWS